MAKYNNKSKRIGWGWVIFLLIAFWPAGLASLWYNMRYLRGEELHKRNRRVGKGGIILAILGLIVLADRLSSVGAFMLLGGLAMLGYNRLMEKRDKRFLQYAAIIGSQSVVSIADVAKTCGRSYETVVNDLQLMLDEDDVFPDTAYLDLGQGLYVRSQVYAPKNRSDSENNMPQEDGCIGSILKHIKKSTEKTSSQPQPKEAEPEMKNTGTEYDDILKQIRQVNDSIKNIKVSEQISQIEKTAGNIFEIITRQPDKRKQVSSFLNYYLPTTLKLLTTYSTLEKQDVNGENIALSKERIEQLMDQLVWAFQQKNDELFAGEARDVNADIKVMETMLAKDGLSRDGLGGDPFAKVLKRGSH